jgi:hypothetical protein
MGSWQSIGALVANYDWQYFPTLAVESSLFRLKQNWAKRPSGRAYLAQCFNATEFYSYRRIYPSEEIRLIQLPIPEDYRLVGVATRQIALKLDFWARTHLDWQFELEIFN